MKYSRQTKAIIFDMDGVLWHSDVAHAEAYKRVLCQIGIDVPCYTTLAGRRTDEVITSLLLSNNKIATPIHVSELTAMKQDIANTILRQKPPIATNCYEVLSKLASRWVLAIASSGSVRNIQLFLSASGSKSLFSAVVSGDDVEYGKPAPDIYLKTLKSLKIHANEAVVIEDAINGIRAAKAAKIPVIAIQGTHDYSELLQEDVLFVVSGLSDLANYNE